MLSIKCEVCGTEIVPLKRSNRKYCSSKCRKKAWKIKNRDKVNKWQREWFKSKRDIRINSLKDKKCPECGLVFNPSSDRMHTYKKFCSTKCRLKFNSKKQTKRRNEILKNPSLNPIAYKKHKLRKQVQDANYKAFSRGCTKDDENHISLKSWEEILDKHDYKCANCGTIENITIDHIHPISKGGRNNKYNIQPLCRKCNSIKSATVSVSHTSL